jgi:hypothetical protein
MHPSYSFLAQSNITLFQSSPVARANTSKNDVQILEKFLYSLSMTSPSRMFQNKKLPIIENIKKIRMRRVTTFIRDGIEN